jgi:hypothetical protein
MHEYIRLGKREIILSLNISITFDIEGANTNFHAANKKYQSYIAY